MSKRVIVRIGYREPFAVVADTLIEIRNILKLGDEYLVLVNGVEIPPKETCNLSNDDYIWFLGPGKRG